MNSSADALALLRSLVEIESPTASAGVRLVVERMAEELAALGGTCEIASGDHLRADFAGDGAPLLLVGHTDTVWPLGTLAAMPFRVDGNRVYGPGTFDMKGGLTVMVEALRQRSGRRAVRVFLSGDEERGSRSARLYLQRASEGVAAAFVLEPPSKNGNPITARQGVGRFRLSIVGRRSHSGLAPKEGVSAIEELAHQILRLHQLSANGVLVNVGIVTGGTAENVVAGEAEARIDVRVTRPSDIARVEAALGALSPVLNGTSLSLDGGWTRPPLEPTPAAIRLFEHVRLCANELGLTLDAEAEAGGSDANLLASFGLPVLDGLGPLGHGAHAEDEHLLLDSVALRARLLARLIDSNRDEASPQVPQS
jgi:glutamate carboxypeptidase